MNKGIFIALSGAILKQKHMDVFAQNIANANTSGYKRERLTFKDYIIPVDNKPAGVEDGRAMADLSQHTIDFSPGTLQRTGNPLDVAISGEGFFALEGDKYTRNGHFSIDGEGNLISQGGVKVLGDGGPITIQGNDIEISTSGEITVDGLAAGRLKIVDFADKNDLQKISGGMFTSTKAGEDISSHVNQGYLEGSNVNAIQEMVQMLMSNREFEAYQKMIRSFDDAASNTISEMGK